MICVHLQTPRLNKVRLSLRQFKTTYIAVLEGGSGKARSVWGGHTTGVKLHEPAGNIQLESTGTPTHDPRHFVSELQPLHGLRFLVLRRGDKMAIDGHL